MTIWKERDGQYGKYVGFNFELNGVEYMGFAEKYTGTNPKAPAYSGKIKIKQPRGFVPQQQQQPYVPQQTFVPQQQVVPQQRVVTQQPVVQQPQGSGNVVLGDNLPF